MKKLFQNLLALMMLLSFSVNGIADAWDEYDFESDGIRYEIVSKKRRTVRVVWASQTNLVIPSKVLHESKAYKVVAIKDNAFTLNNKKLVSVEIPSTVTIIEEFAFFTCSNLTSVKMCEGVTRIENRAFVGCNKLISIELPSTLTSIDEYALSVLRLKNVYCKALTPPDGPVEVFDEDTYKEGTLYVPVGTKEEYESADPWRNFINIVEIDFSSVR